MTDVLTPQQRRLNMSRVRGRDTKPEMLIRRELHARGLRYRLHDRKLPGRPDLVFPKYRTALFVHGCFWHAHGCALSKLPVTRQEFWKQKLDGNGARDRKAIKALLDGREEAFAPEQQQFLHDVRENIDDSLSSRGPAERVTVAELVRRAGVDEDDVAQAEARARASKIEPWTERVMSELEVAVALAVGHLTGAEVARRISIGRQGLDDGITLAMGAEARAALEGAAAVQPLLAWAGQNRTTLAPALSLWLLLERLDRERGPTLVASSVDSLATGKGVMSPGVADALALIEQRRPGRLETVHPQSPRGRATLASAIARAYRAIGGMRDERQG